MKKIFLILTALVMSVAVFAQKITTPSGITSGNKYYIGATTGSNDFYFYVDGSARTESIKGTAKTDKEDAVALTFTAVTGGWTIQFDNGLYLGLKNAKDNGAVQVVEDAVVWTIDEDVDNGLLKLHPNDNYYLQKNNNGTQFGSYRNAQTDVWLESAGSAPVSAILESIVIKGAATKMAYEVGEAFDPAGLEVWGLYTKYVKNDSTSKITSGITWSINPETFTTVSGNASVTLSASYKDKTSSDTTITGINVSDPEDVTCTNLYRYVYTDYATGDPYYSLQFGDENWNSYYFAFRDAAGPMVGQTYTMTDMIAGQTYASINWESDAILTVSLQRSYEGLQEKFVASVTTQSGAQYNLTWAAANVPASVAEVDLDTLIQCDFMNNGFYKTFNPLVRDYSNYDFTMAFTGDLPTVGQQKTYTWKANTVYIGNANFSLPNDWSTMPFDAKYVITGTTGGYEGTAEYSMTNGNKYTFDFTYTIPFAEDTVYLSGYDLKINNWGTIVFAWQNGTYNASLAINSADTLGNWKGNNIILNNSSFQLSATYTNLGIYSIDSIYVTLTPDGYIRLQTSILCKNNTLYVLDISTQAMPYYVKYDTDGTGVKWQTIPAAQYGTSRTMGVRYNNDSIWFNAQPTDEGALGYSIKEAYGTFGDPLWAKDSLTINYDPYTSWGSPLSVSMAGKYYDSIINVQLSSRSYENVNGDGVWNYSFGCGSEVESNRYSFNFGIYCPITAPARYTTYTLNDMTEDDRTKGYDPESNGFNYDIVALNYELNWNANEAERITINVHTTNGKAYKLIYAAATIPVATDTIEFAPVDAVIHQQEYWFQFEGDGVADGSQYHFQVALPGAEIDPTTFYWKQNGFYKPNTTIYNNTTGTYVDIADAWAQVDAVRENEQIVGYRCCAYILGYDGHCYHACQTGNLSNDSLITYLSPVYNTTDVPTSGILRWDTLQCTNYTLVEDTTTSLTEGWYVVTDTLQIGSLPCTGDVHLILADGAQLTTTGGAAAITVSSTGTSLTIYAQSTDPAQMGTLKANGGMNAAAIGGGFLGSGSGITINGGRVTATGGVTAAGIGGGYQGSGSNITINGGIVTATGGGGGAGIGGGYFSSGTNITINGGTVTATGGSDATGIGGGVSGSASNIFVATNLIVKADGNNPPTTVITNDGTDLANSLSGKRYATIEPAPAVSNDLTDIINSELIGKNSGDTVVLNLSNTIDYVISQPVDLGLVNIIINGNGAKVTLADSTQIAGQQRIEINNVNFDCAANTKLAPIALSANPDSSLVGTNFQTEGTSLRANAFYNAGTITLSNCNFSGVKTSLVSANKREWNLKNLTIKNCIVQFDVVSGIDSYINWYGNSKNEGSIKEIVIEGSTLYNIVENNSNYFLRYANNSNSQPQKAWAEPQFDGKCSWTMTNNTFVNLPSNKNFANNYPNKNPICEFTWKGNIFYNTTSLTKAIQGNVANFTAADNAIIGITKAVDATDNQKYATIDSLLIQGDNRMTTPTTALDFTKIDSLVNNFAPATTSYAGSHGFGDPRWLTGFTVTANVNDTAMGSVTGAGKYAVGSTATLTANAKEGYRFSNWTNANGGTVSTANPWTLTVAGDTTVTANFVPLRVEVQEEVDVPAITYDYALGYTGASSTFDFSMVYDAIGCYANDAIVYGYNPITEEYIPRAMSTYDGFFSAAGVPTAYNSTSTPFCIKFYNDGTFWYCTHPDVAEYGAHYTCSWILVNPTTGDAVQYNFSMNDITRTANITANVNNTAMGSVSGSGTYNIGSQATLTATPAAHYHFVNWSNGSTSNPLTVTVEKDSSLTANFAIDTHTVTLVANDEAFGTVEGAGTYNYGTQVTAIAVPAAHYHFVNWSNGETNDTIVIDLAGDTTLTANFAIDTHLVTLAVDDVSHGTVEGAGFYDYGIQAIISATADPCYHFVSWDDGVTDNPRTIVVESDTSFTAIFELNVYESEFNEVACDSYTWDEDTYTLSGDYQHRYATINGCDSTATLHLVVNYSNSGEFSEQAAFSYIWDGREYTESGNYTFVYQNVYDCDSTVTLHLIVTSFELPVIDQLNKKAVMLSHYPNGDGEYVDYIDYRWYRDGELVAEGFDNFWEPSVLNGCYHVEVPVDETKTQWVLSNELCFQNGVLVGIDEAEAAIFSFSVAPNPVVKGSMMTVTTQLPEQQLQGASLMMFDLNGRIVTTMPMSQQSVTLPAQQTSGVYVIQITTRSGEKYLQKVVVR